MKSCISLIASAILLSLFVPAAQAVERGGPATLKIGQTEVVKNGFGTRNKMMLSLYECSLYLPQKSGDSATILDSDQPMAVRIEITSKFVSQSKMIASLTDGFRKSTGGHTTAIATDIKKFSDCFSEPIKMGDVFVLAYAPNTGVVVLKNDQLKGTVGDLAFKKALMGIWLGDNPVDKNLRTAMLGTASLR
ncbi:chalcone isomerase family protein [Mariniblastus sp.]|nr:chalcone isomerase family protein [Mariniblastus sp.]